MWRNLTKPSIGHFAHTTLSHCHGTEKGLYGRSVRCLLVLSDRITYLVQGKTKMNESVCIWNSILRFPFFLAHLLMGIVHVIYIQFYLRKILQENDPSIFHLFYSLSVLCSGNEHNVSFWNQFTIYYMFIWYRKLSVTCTLMTTHNIGSLSNLFS